VDNTAIDNAAVHAFFAEFGDDARAPRSTRPT
jgi:hypothetical protein